MSSIAGSSFWLNQLDDLEFRSALTQDLEVDVAVVGGGFTGLWTAYYLKEIQPSLEIAVFEKSYCGFGASGRNGGWASALFPSSLSKIAKLYSEDAATAMYRAMIEALSTLEKVVKYESMDCDFHKGGTLNLARGEAQMERISHEVREAHDFGLSNYDIRILTAAEVRDQITATNVLGASFTPHCASINPAKLVRSLAKTVENKGVRILESSQVDSIGVRQLLVGGRSVKFRNIVRATEGYTSQLSGMKREVAPIYSMMIATRVLEQNLWDAIGWPKGITLTDGRNLIIYAQRTEDNRIAMGGRGAPYHFGSAVRQSFDRNLETANSILSSLISLFPILRGVEVASHWGGPLGVSRDFFPSVGFDKNSGFGWAGGYVGDGVTTSSLAGQTLAHLICGIDSELTKLCWVDHRSRKWEPEPLRWLGINASRALAFYGDKAEESGKKNTWQSRLNEMIIGR